jgi:membrane protease YdiL (CAAX protease family)
LLVLLNVVPTLILASVLYVGNKTFKSDLLNLNKSTADDIFYSFCISIIGFNVLTAISSTLIPNITTQSDIRTPMMYIYAVLFSPVFEELICRKILTRAINKYFNWWMAASISSLLFSLLHFNLTGFLGYAFIGLIWCYYYRKSNNILVPILSHFLFNYTAILIQSLKG